MIGHFIEFLGAVHKRFNADRARKLIPQIDRYLKPGDTVLDLGTGTGYVAAGLSTAGYTVTALDVKNHSLVPDLTPVIYDGNTIPFETGRFDVCLILTVLHHTADPEKILREARRVAERIIIIEDVIQGGLNTFLTYFLDSVLNREFIGHPFSHKSDDGWRNLFKAMAFNLTDTAENRVLWVIKQRVYILEKF